MVFAAALVTVGALVVVFAAAGAVLVLVDFSIFIPASFASFARADLRLEAVFLWRRFFLTALSYSD